MREPTLTEPTLTEPTPADPTSPEQALPGRRRTLLRWALALLLLALVARLAWADPEPLRRLLAVRTDIVLGIACLSVLSQGLVSLRLALTVEKCGAPRIARTTWFRLTCLAQFLNLFVPQLGNVYRAVVLKREHGIAYMSYASGLLVFVWLDTVIGLTIACGVIASTEPGLVLAGAPALVWLAGAVAAMVFGVPVAARALSAFAPRSRVLKSAQARAFTLLELAASTLKDARFLLAFFGTNLLVTGAQLASLWLGFHALGAELGIGTLILFQVFANLSQQVAVTPGNLGLTELVYSLLAHLTHGALEHGLAVGLLQRAVGTLTIVLLGVALGGASQLFGARKRSTSG